MVAATSHVSPSPTSISVGKTEIVCLGMLAPRKFMAQTRRKRRPQQQQEASQAADTRNWVSMMNEIDEAGSAVSVLRTKYRSSHALPRDLVLGTLVRFKQLKKWNLVSEVFLITRRYHLNDE